MNKCTRRYAQKTEPGRWKSQRTQEIPLENRTYIQTPTYTATGQCLFEIGLRNGADKMVLASIKSFKKRRMRHS